MLKKLQKSNNRGFTIIEVMIVLAIAGLILLIVFLAVPALQRSARNTQRKNDAAAVGAAVANYISNNNGNVPDTVTYAAGVITVNCTKGGYNGATCDKTDSNTETAKVGIFTGATVDKAAAAGDVTAPSGTTTAIYFAPGWNCNSSGTALGTASPRSAAILFNVENGGTVANECQEQ